MTIALVAIVAVVLFAIYWFVIRKPSSIDELPEPEQHHRLPPKPSSRPPEQTQRHAADKGTRADDELKDKDEGKEPISVTVKQPEAQKEKAAASAQQLQAAGKKDDSAIETDDPKSSEQTVEKSDSSDSSDRSDVPIEADEQGDNAGKGAADDSGAQAEIDVLAVRKGLGRSRSKEGFFGRLARLITGKKDIDPAIIDEIEEVLITSDVGVKTTDVILNRLRQGLKSNELKDSDAVWAMLRQEAIRILDIGRGGIRLTSKPTVVLMVGVNGSGKTTTIGKIATQYKAAGKQIMLAAGDTFRAAAVQQLAVWGHRVGCDVVKGKDRADPAAVVFDAIRQGEQGGADLILADTAGRLHTNVNLMEELKKVVRSMDKALSGAPHEILLVIDATNGQNALAQSREFAEALPLTGIVLTKLDGTAKGGMILGICDELAVPVRYIGLGEKSDDLRPFNAREFVDALLGSADGDTTQAA